jgi:hypothetical protein
MQGCAKAWLDHPELKRQYGKKWSAFWADCAKSQREGLHHGGEEKHQPAGEKKIEKKSRVSEHKGESGIDMKARYPYQFGKLRVGRRGGLQMVRKGKWVYTTFDKIPEAITDETPMAELAKLKTLQNSIYHGLPV